jgi:hypothetical protein
MAKVAMMTDGLKRRQTYEEVIDYIENDNDKIRYPDRTAEQLRNTFELSQLDGVGMQLMEQQQFREMKEREKEQLLRQIASNTSKSITEARATQTEESPSTGQENTTQFQSPQSTTQSQQIPPWLFPAGSRVGDPTERSTAPFVTQHFNIASDYDEREQERRDIEEAADVSLDMSYERELARREDARIMHQMALQSVHQAHPIHSLIQSLSPIQRQQALSIAHTFSPSSTTSSFIRELEAQFQSPPRTQQLALPPPMPVAGRAGSSSDGAIVPVSDSPIPVASPTRPNTPKPARQRPQVPSPEQPASSASTPTKRRTRVTERKGTKKETNDPETGHPGGAPKETKPRK